MAISLRAAGTPSGFSGQNAITKPTGTVQNDVMVAFVFSFSSSSDPTGPTGWTKVVSKNDNTQGLTAWTKVAGASEPANYTWTGVTNTGGVINSYSGVDTTTVTDGSGSASSTSSPTTAPSITTTGSSDWWLVGTSLDGSDSNAFGTEGGFTNDTDDSGGDATWHKALSASGATGTQAFTWPTGATGTMLLVDLCLLASSGSTVNGNSTILAEAGILGGLAGMGILPRGIAAGPTVGGGLAGMGILPSGINAGTALGGGLSGQGATGGGLAGQGEIQASSAALDSAILEGIGNLGGGMGGQGEVNASSAATPSITFQGIGSFLGGLGAGGILGGGIAAASALAQGLVGAAGFISGFGGQALINAAGNTGGAIHAAATILGLGNLGANLTSGAGTASSPLGGGQAGLNPASAATPSLTLGGNGTLGGNLIQGVAIVLGSSVAAASSSFRGIGSFLGGFGGSAGFAGGFGGQALVSGLPGLLRLPPFSFAFNQLQQLLNYAFGQKQAIKFVYGATQALTFSFKQVPAVATPNSTITTTMTATDVNGNLLSNLATCACTVTFPDGSTQAFSLVGGTLTNLGAGKYSITYNTKTIGEIVEDWSGTDQTGNKAEFHNITPVSF